MKLYGYWRSSASWRVRIALGLKGIAYEAVPVHLVRDGGEQHAAAHRARNPMRQVPVLEVTTADGAVHQLGQSMAILEYLEETYPETPLLPRAPLERAAVRQLAELMNSGIQPLHNLAVLQELERRGVDKGAWAASFVERGLEALEALLGEHRGAFCVGERPTFADVCLVPQLYAARRFGVELNRFERALQVEAACAALPAFQRAHADVQPDATPA